MNENNTDIKVVFSIEAKIFLGIVLLSLIWRGIAIPWDFSSCFTQLWISIFTMAFFLSGLPYVKKSLLLLARFFFLPFWTILVFGTIYFDPGTVMPFMFLGIVIAIILLLLSCPKMIATVPVIIAIILSLMFIATFDNAVKHIRTLSKIRNLEGKSVREIHLSSMNRKEKKTIIIDQKPVIDKISEALHHTSPYAPIRGWVYPLWQVTLLYVDETSATFQIDKGDQGKSETIFMEFDVELYQNPMLYKVFEEEKIKLWD